MMSLPNILTLFNLLCGSLAIYGIFYESETAVIIFFVLCLLFDFLDGFAARALKTTSVIGKDLDSLADLISFGLFPTFLVVDILERSVDLAEKPVFGLVFLLAAGAGLRLAKFNSSTTQTTSFEGMPTPAMAMVVFSVWLNLENTRYPGLDSLAEPVLILFIALLLAFLMNLPLRFIKFTLNGVWSVDRIVSFLLILIAVVSLFFSWRLSVMITTMSYVFFSLLSPIFLRNEAVPRIR